MPTSEIITNFPVPVGDKFGDIKLLSIKDPNLGGGAGNNAGDLAVITIATKIGAGAGATAAAIISTLLPAGIVGGAAIMAAIAAAPVAGGAVAAYGMYRLIRQ